MRLKPAALDLGVHDGYLTVQCKQYEGVTGVTAEVCNQSVTRSVFSKDGLTYNLLRILWNLGQ